MDQLGVSLAKAELFDEAVVILGEEKTDLDDFVGITGTLMRLTQQNKGLRHHGQIKRDLVISVFTLLVEKSGLFNKGQIEDLKDFITDTLPGLIDAIKSVARVISETLDDVVEIVEGVDERVSVCCFGKKRVRKG